MAILWSGRAGWWGCYWCLWCLCWSECSAAGTYAHTRYVAPRDSTDSLDNGGKKSKIKSSYWLRYAQNAGSKKDNDNHRIRIPFAIMMPQVVCVIVGAVLLIEWNFHRERTFSIRAHIFVVCAFQDQKSARLAHMWERTFHASPLNSW